MSASLLAQRPQVLTKAQRTRTAKPARQQRVVRCSATTKPDAFASLGQKAAAAGLAGLLSLAPVTGAIASEFDVLAEETPTSTYFIDDASVLNKVTKGDINKKLKTLEIETGYRLEVVTVRKLEVETDAFAYADKVLENWYPTVEEGDKKGVLLVVTSAKDGALTGGPAFLEAVGDDLIDSIVSENIPIFTELERYNETVTSSIERVSARLNGREVPDAPQRADVARQRTYKTREETDKTKSVTGTIVATLLIIAFVVPMLQYYGYTARD